jgi:hypothetical protein
MIIVTLAQSVIQWSAASLMMDAPQQKKNGCDELPKAKMINFIANPYNEIANPASVMASK